MWSHAFGSQVTLISDADYPEKWPSLMNDLVVKMGTQDLNVIKGVLLTANAIFSRYRDQYKSDALFTEINHSCAAIQQPLLDLFQMCSAQVAPNANNAAQLKVIDP